VYGLTQRRRLDRLTAIFLVFTVLTSVTGFGFPFTQLLPSHKVGIISLVLLALAIAARYVFHLAGAWRLTYVVTAAMALISQLLRPGGATVHEGSGTKGAGSDAEGTAFPGRPAHCSGAVYWVDDFGGEKVSSWVCPDCLMGRLFKMTATFPGSSNPSLHQEQRYAYDHDKRRHADLLQGLGCGTARGLQPRLAP